MVLVVIQYDHMIVEEIIDVLFRVELLPIFKAEPWKLLEHLAFLQKVHFLGFLLVSLGIQFNELKQ